MRETLRLIKPTIALLAILAFCRVSHADTLTDFTFSGTILTENKDHTNTGTITGSVVIDVTNPLDDLSSETADFTATYDVASPAHDYSFTFSGTPTASKLGSGTLANPYYYVLAFSTTTGLSSPTTIGFDLDFIDVGGVITVCQINTNGFTGNGDCDQNSGGTGEQTFLDSNSLPNSPGDADLVTGTLTPSSSQVASTTPEPSSLFLLGTGLLSAVGVARRRFLRA